jgi:hypothetical protein
MRWHDRDADEVAERQAYERGVRHDEYAAGGMPASDVVQARDGAGDGVAWVFAAGKVICGGVGLEGLEFLGALLSHLGCCQALDAAEVQFAQPRVDVGLESAGAGGGGRRLAGAAQGRAPDRVELGGHRPLGQPLGLLVTTGRQRDVAAPRVPVFSVPDGLTVPDEN